MAERSAPSRRLRKQPTRRTQQRRRMYHSVSAAPPVVEMPQSVSRRRRRRDTDGIRKLLGGIGGTLLSARWISLALTALCVYALVLIGTNERFFLTRIPVEGATAYTPEEIVEVSGLAGRHVFYVDLGQAAAQISGLPGIVAANVELRWPNDLRIVVQEKAPVLIWEEAGVQYWVTAEGGLLPAGRQAIELPHIKAEVPVVATEQVLTIRELEDKERAAADETVQTYLRYVPEEVLLGAEQLREIRPNLETLYYSPSGGLSFDDDGGWRVYFGTGGDMVRKLAAYQGILDHLAELGVTPNYVSVANLAKPYYYAPALVQQGESDG